MRAVKIYVDNQLLDLFDDEQIVVTSTGQQLTDLSGVVTDFSQTFTVPASEKNNIIFEHYYNNDLNAIVDHSLRRAARIEIDDVPFLSGKLQLQKGVVENGVATNYTADFFGDVVTLKDKIKEDKLSDLNYTSINHLYTASEVLKRIDGTTLGDVKYPLISSKRPWQASGGGVDDITTPSGSILYTELFPAVRMSRLLQLIQTKYGVTFNGSWLQTDNFKQLFLWYKNKEENNYISPAIDLTNSNDVNWDTGYIFGTLHYEYVNPVTLPTNQAGSATNVRHTVRVNINTGSSADYYLDVYKNNVLITTLTIQGGNSVNNIVLDEPNNPSINEFYRFKLRSTVVATYTGQMVYLIKYIDTTNSPNPNDLTITYSNPFETIVTSSNISLSAQAPDMKVIDFLKGIASFANCVLIGTGNNKFDFMPYQDYFSFGKYYDITRYVDEKLITVNRPPLYKNVAFKYKESKSLTNRTFFDLFGRNFADLTNSFDYDGEDYTIELPFETIMGNKFTGTELQVGYCFDQQQKPYVPAPVLLYELPLQTSNVSFRYETSTTVTKYFPFGQDLVTPSVDYSSCFGLEVSTFFLDPRPNSIFTTYYQQIFSNLYNRKTRLLNVKTNLPIRLISDIKLNDKLIIRDKTYIIVNKKANLVTGDVELNLLSWWVGQNLEIFKTIKVGGGTAQVGFDVQDGIVTLSDDDPSPFVSANPKVIVGSGVINLTADENLTGESKFFVYTYTVDYPDGQKFNGTLTVEQQGV
jgi:hypothetical protein